MPARASARSAASTGAVPNHCGSVADAPRPAIRATGVSPIRSAAASEPISSADAPSFSGDALPGVIVPSGRNDGFSPASFSGLESGSDALVASQVDAVHRGHEVVVEARLPRCVGEVVGAGREGVLPVPADAVLVGDQLVGLAQRHGPLGRHPLVDQPPPERRRHRGHVAGREGPRRLRQHPRRAGHRLHAPRDHHIGVAGLHRAGREHRRVEARSAQPVDGRRRHRRRQTREQHGHPAHVAVVLAGPVGIAPHHVADLGRVQVGCLGQQAGQRGGGQVVGTYLGQGTAEPSERRAGGGVHEGCGHSSSSARTCWAIRNAVLAAGTPQ